MDNRLRQAIQEKIALQQQGITAQEAQLQQMQNTPQEMDLSSLMNLTDAWTGSNFSKNYKRPKTQSEKAKEAMYLQQGLDARKQGLLSSEIKLLQAIDKKDSRVPALTKGQEAVDRSFGKEYSDWVTGGFSSVKTNLEKLSGAYDSVMADGEMGQRGMPKAIRQYYSPESVSLEEDIASVTYQSLKKILGGQFSAEEGKNLVDQAYNPALPDSENSKKIEATIKQLSAMADAKQKAAEHFAQYGTLENYQGSKATDMNGFLKELKNKYLKKIKKSKSLRKMGSDKPEVETKTYEGITYKKVGDSWVAQ